MTSWNIQDTERIRAAVSLPANKVALDAIATSMDWLSENYPAAIATVKAKLDKLEALEASLDEIQNSANFYLKKAGDLEWDLSVGSKGAGIETSATRLRAEIAIALGLDVDSLSGASNSGGWGSGRLLRS